MAVGRAFASLAVDRGSIPGRNLPKLLKQIVKNIKEEGVFGRLNRLFCGVFLIMEKMKTTKEVGHIFHLLIINGYADM